MTRRIVGPFNRVEGDLEISLEVTAGAVSAAYVNAPLFRGFEQMLLGKAPADALVIVPRICGICSVAQSAAAAHALAAASGLNAPPNGRLAANLTQAAENVADHLTHFYLFFMPDFAHAAYGAAPWHAATAARFRALKGSAATEVLSARTAFMRIMGILAGKWPHTLSLQPGGSSRPLQGSEKIRIYRLLREFRGFLERVLFGDTLEAVAAIASRDALYAWAESDGAGSSDCRRFLAISAALGLESLGRSSAVLMSAGAYAQERGPWFARGIHDGADGELDPTLIREDVRYSHYAPRDAVAPAIGLTVPQADKEGAYSWCKAPRLGARVVETGAFARQVIAGHPLARDLVRRGGSNVASRVIARLLELARLVPAMEQWTQALQPGEPYCLTSELPDSADTCGLIEAARGTLGHWLSIRRGRIQTYQIIAPTTWNFSPRDAGGTPGAAEQALIGTPAGEPNAVAPAIYHVVRSFDPCMVCTVH